MKTNDDTPTPTTALTRLQDWNNRAEPNASPGIYLDVQNVIQELLAYRQGGLTEEILRRHDGSIKVGRGISFVLTSDRDAALSVADEWRRILSTGSLHNTSPVLRDVLTTLASLCGRQSRSDNAAAEEPKP